MTGMSILELSLQFKWLRVNTKAEMQKADFIVMKETEKFKENQDICNENIKLSDKSTELSR